MNAYRDKAEDSTELGAMRALVVAVGRWTSGPDGDNAGCAALRSAYGHYCDVRASFVPEQAPYVGVLTRLWYYMFEDPAENASKALPEYSTTEEECAAQAYSSSLGRCPGVADDRCEGGNCTRHCKELCEGRCK